jgi:predicted Abi (CAAX) family protease
VSFVDSLQVAIALGLTVFMVLLRFDAERIMHSDYFRYRTAWLGPLSYYALVLIFALGIAWILPQGRVTLFLTGGEPGTVLPVMITFGVVAVLNGAAFAFLRFGAIRPIPSQLLPSRIVGAAANALAEEIQFRSIVLGMLIFATGPQWAGLANLVQALLYGIVHRRLLEERDWYFLAGSVLLAYGAGAATLATGSIIPAIVGHFAVTMGIFAFAGGRVRERPI